MPLGIVGKILKKVPSWLRLTRFGLIVLLFDINGYRQVKKNTRSDQMKMNEVTSKTIKNWMHQFEYDYKT